MEYTILSKIQEFHNLIFINKIMIVFSFLGDKGFIWLAFAIIFSFYYKDKNLGIFILISLLIASVLGEGLLKNIIQRPRPFITFGDLKPLISVASKYSMPSGHATSSFAAAFSIVYLNRKLITPVLIIAVLIAFSRVWLIVHYPSDIIGGMILGLFSAYLAIIIMTKLKNGKMLIHHMEKPGNNYSCDSKERI